jgi:protein-S-isoprenylcysteine O-methyltransferase Ste14
MSLIVQAILGFAFLMLVMGAALFISAGSMHYWQAWVYLTVFGGCTILITNYLALYDRELLAGRVQAGPVAETRPVQRVIQSMASLFFITLFIVPGLDCRFSWSHVPPALSLISDVFVALGFLIVFLTFRENTYTRSTIEVSANQRVITTGPYSVVRHPMYAGAMLLLLFTPIALGSWVALPLVVPLALVIAARIRDEEAFLSANLDGYVEYRRRVRYRLVPYIW